MYSMSVDKAAEDLTFLHCTWQDVATSISSPIVTVVAGEQPSMVPFLHDYKSNRRLVIWLERSTSFSDCVQLIQKNLVKLAFTHSISVAKKDLCQ